MFKVTYKSGTDVMGCNISADTVEFGMNVAKFYRILSPEPVALVEIRPGVSITYVQDEKCCGGACEKKPDAPTRSNIPLPFGYLDATNRLQVIVDGERVALSLEELIDLIHESRKPAMPMPRWIIDGVEYSLFPLHEFQVNDARFARVRYHDEGGISQDVLVRKVKP